MPEQVKQQKKKYAQDTVIRYVCIHDAASERSQGRSATKRKYMRISNKYFKD